MNKLCSLMVGAAVIGLGVYLVQKLPQPRTNSTSFVEQCWNLPVSLIDRPISSSAIWVMGNISRIDERHGALVATYASQSELSPAARQGLCVSLAKLAEAAPVESQASCESNEKLSHLTPAGRHEFCLALQKMPVAAPAPAEQTTPVAPDRKG